ncbi:hypothetical protein [Microcoleus sp. ARI1-A3]|uniref:hypothetical protein n=1 Tax=Microcoleus sp. ARI1-A3 TaxID=2818558 RepID=UPI002FD01FAC
MAKEIKLVRSDYGILVRPVYRQCAVSYTDLGNACGTFFPFKTHKAVGNDTGKSNSLEIFNNTMKNIFSGNKNSFII